MPDEPFISYAQNGEDVVLWRALGHVRGGIYVDVGGWDPDVDSVTRLFYDRGWRGVDIEPVPELAERFRVRRPDDEVVQVAVAAEAGELVLHRFGGTGLSTLDDQIAAEHEAAGLETEDITVSARRLDDVLDESALVTGAIHFLKIDVEGAEDQILASVDLRRWRPWVLVIEATRPNSTETTHHRWEQGVLAAGYVFTLFDGLSRYYVAEERLDLAPALSYPACPLDDFELARVVRLQEDLDDCHRDLDEARAQALRWRREAVGYWANAVARVQRSEELANKARADASKLKTQLERVRERHQEAKADRRRLRARVQRLAARVEQVEGQLRTSGPRERLRAAVKKATGA